MKYKATLVAFFLLAHLLVGQNLISNPGFEIIDECPTGLKQLEYAKNWKRANAGTPELFHNCGFKSKVVEPFEGEGMAGVIFLTDYSSNIEYLQTKLVETLEQGKKYCLSYHIRLSKNSLIAINKIGAYFSRERLVSPDWKQFKKHPQAVNQEVVDNVDDWIKVENSFTAKGGEEYMTIGNFYEKHYLIEQRVKSGERRMRNGANDRTVYYYLDNINLYLVSGGCNVIVREVEPVKIEKKWSHIVYFEKDIYRLSELEERRLDSFVEQLPTPLYHLIRIEGHTDKDATFEYNVQLSQNRANEVKERMTNFGLSNTYTTWSGENKPMNEEITEEEKAKNRRVTITVER